MFPDADLVRDLQHELDGMIEDGVSKITTLINKSDTRMSSMVDTEDTFIMDQKKKTSSRASKYISLLY